MTDSIRVKAICGGIFEVQARAVWRDFRALLIAMHKLDDAGADAMLARRQAEEPDFWIQWFKEHWMWDEVEKHGTLISPSTNGESKRVCAKMRKADDTYPGHYIQ
jgi:hypothetical protein